MIRSESGGTKLGNKKNDLDFKGIEQMREIWKWKNKFA